jgi:hypothetical protein
MKTRLALLFGSILVLCVALLATVPGAAQRGGARGGPPAHSAPPSHNAPRANQGRIPSPPVARSNPGEQRQTEHLPTGHTNDTPHVNNNHYYGHESPNDQRFHLDHPFANGRFAHFGAAYRYRVIRFDRNLRRFWFPGGFYFDVALWDWPLCADWCWNCGDDFVVYEDPDHPGWYLLYNVYTGVYVHVQYMGW